MKSKKRFLPGILISLGTALTVCLLCYTGLFYAPDQHATDAMIQQRRKTHDDIVVIGIDSETVTELGNPMRWSRKVLAQVIHHLNCDEENRPAVIGIDLMLSEEKDPEGDRELAEACAEYGNVVVAGWAEYGTEVIRDADSWAMVHGVIRWEEPYDSLQESAEIAHVNAVQDADRILRHGQLWIRKPDGGKVKSFARAIYEKYCTSCGKTPNAEPTATSAGLYYLRYAAPHSSYEDTWTFLQCLKEEIHSPFLKQRIVLIGGYALSLGDQVYTSLDHSKMMYGIEAQANMIDQFMRGDNIQEINGQTQLAILFLFLLLAGLLLWNRKTVPSLLIWLLGAGIWVGGCLLLREQGLVAHVLWGPLGITIIFAVTILLNYTRSYLARQKISRTFGRYVDPTVIRELMENDTTADLGGKLCQIAVLFVDIRGFTTLSESLPPQTVVEILNQYLSLTTACIMRNHGTLDKFVGDCTMAIWGAPVPAEDPVMQACRAAVEMIEEGKRLTQEISSSYGKTVSYGIGIHYGPAVVGNIGAPMRMDYTAIGDTVNTAARLEANAPAGQILISETVRNLLGDRAATSEPEHEIRLKGKNDRIGIYVLEKLI